MDAQKRSEAIEKFFEERNFQVKTGIGSRLFTRATIETANGMITLVVDHFNGYADVSTYFTGGKEEHKTFEAIDPEIRQPAYGNIATAQIEQVIGYVTAQLKRIEVAK